MYTIEKDFSRKKFGTEVIRESGRDFCINYSSILTKLIHECGRLCESYASDLFVTWYNIEKLIQEKLINSKSYLFGIRENGVDHNGFILSRYDNNGENARYEYRKIYRLDVLLVNEKIIMELYEIEIPHREVMVA